VVEAASAAAVPPVAGSSAPIPRLAESPHLTKGMRES